MTHARETSKAGSNVHDFLLGNDLEGSLDLRAKSASSCNKKCPANTYVRCHGGRRCMELGLRSGEVGGAKIRCRASLMDKWQDSRGE